MITAKSTKEQDNARKMQIKDEVKRQEELAAEQNPVKERQHVTCTRCGFELYSDEDSEFDGRSGRMHHVARCLELCLSAISRMKSAGAKDPDVEAALDEEAKAKKAEESKQKSIEENAATRGEIVAGRNREQWEIDLEAKGGESKVNKDTEAASKKAADKKAAEKKSQDQKVEDQKKDHLSQDKKAAEVSGEKEHQDSQIEKAK